MPCLQSIKYAHPWFLLTWERCEHTVIGSPMPLHHLASNSMPGFGKGKCGSTTSSVPV